MSVKVKDLNDRQEAESRPLIPSISFNRTLWAWRSMWSLGALLTYFAIAPFVHWFIAAIVAIALQIVLSELERPLWIDRNIYNEDGEVVGQTHAGCTTIGMALLALGFDAFLNLTGTAPLVENLHLFPPLQIAYAMLQREPIRIQGFTALAICLMLGVVVAAAAEILRERAHQELAADEEE